MAKMPSLSPPATVEPDPEVRRQTRRVVTASVVGTAIEYYDFSLYAVATSIVFNKVFFPASDPLVGALLGFVTFFVGYCARPLGGIIFGHFGDRIGRKRILLLTVLIMGAGTFAIGLVPSYDQIGVAAPIILVALRLLQGIGIGGEYGGGMTMTVEHAPAARRGFYSSLVHVGVPLGLVLPTLFLTALATMPEESFLSWGWRVPFLSSIVLVALGLFIRFKITESPAFEQVKQEGRTAKLPVWEALRTYPSNILLGIGAKIAESGLFNVYAVFAITYCVTELGVARTTVLTGVMIGAVLECMLLPVFGALSDRIGRKQVYLAGMAFQLALAVPFFLLLDTRQPVLIWLVLALGLGVGHGSVYGAQGAMFSELFPARVRYSGLSLVGQLGPILGGGLSPIIAASLLAGTMSTTAITVYMAAIAVLSGLCALGLRRTKDLA